VADPVPGATYNGTADDGAEVQLVVSSDGASVVHYRIAGVVGHWPDGTTCDMVAEGDQGYWPPAAISGNSFSYTLGTATPPAISLKGSFSGAQSAAGTFELTSSYQGKICDSGTVQWSATTSSGSSGSGTGQGTTGATGTTGTTGTTGGSGTGNGSGGGSGSGNGNGNGNGSGNGTGTGTKGGKTAATRMSLRLQGTGMLAGKISSTGKCVAGRAVQLWLGKHRVGSTHSTRSGTFAFADSATIRGHRVRATVTVRRLTGLTCDAGRSNSIKA
jgi:hypothetical protein